MNKDVETILLKSKALGLPIETIPTMCNHKIYLIKQDTENSMLLIPDDVEYIGEYKLDHIRGNLEVIGGNNLNNTSCLFSYCKLTKLNIDRFNTSNVINMRYMFYNCFIKELDISNIDMHSVKSTESMFRDYISNTAIDLTKVIFKDREVDTVLMFYRCNTKVKLSDEKLKKQLNNDLEDWANDRLIFT